MFKKLGKSTLAVVFAIGGSAIAMEKPAPLFNVGVTPAQQAAQKEQFAKIMQEQQAKQAAARGAQAPAVTAKPAAPVMSTTATPALLPQGRIFGRFNRADLANRRANFIKSIQAKKATAKAAISSALTPAEKQLREKQVAEVEEWANELQAERVAEESQQQAAPAGFVRVFNPFTGTYRNARESEVEGWESESGSESSSESGSESGSESSDVD